MPLLILILAFLFYFCVNNFIASISLHSKHPFSKYVDMQTRISYKVVTESAIDTEQPSYNAREHILYIHPAVYENHR